MITDKEMDQILWLIAHCDGLVTQSMLGKVKAFHLSIHLTLSPSTHPGEMTELKVLVLQ